MPRGEGGIAHGAACSTAPHGQGPVSWTLADALSNRFEVDPVPRGHPAPGSRLKADVTPFLRFTAGKVTPINSCTRRAPQGGADESC
jgi:hypothetical protein